MASLNLSSSQAAQRQMTSLRHHARQSPPHDKDQRLVRTPYGRGLVIRTRLHDQIQEIELLEWQTNATNNKRPPPMLYCAKDLYKSITPVVGDDVVCLYGRGRVVCISEIDNNKRGIVELSSWRLAHRCTVKCFLPLEDIHVVQKRTLYEMDSWERVRYANECKATATGYFQDKNYTQALQLYETAVAAVRYVQHDTSSDNELRADLLVVMITCCNNAATCCIHLSQWSKVTTLSNNALVLLEALYEKRGLKIHTLLNKEGYSDAKLFGEWQVKSLLLKANGWMEQEEYAQALAVLKDAHHVISQYTTSTDYNLQDAHYKQSHAVLCSQGKQLKRLHATCVQRKKAQKKKEKQRAQAMFGNDKTTTTTAAASSRSSSSAKNDKNPSIKSISWKENVLPNNKSKTRTTNVTSKEPTIRKGVLDMTEDSSDAPMDDLPSPTPKRSVSFSDDTKPGEHAAAVMVEDEYDDGDQEMPWYEQHKEAFILSGVVGLAALAVALVRSRK